MKLTKLTPYISVIHSDIQNHPLFEGCWPIPDGVTLNSYFVRGNKTALIELTADWEEAISLLKSQLNLIDGADKIDYLILNHLEPDHTGFLPRFIQENPSVEIISTAKGCALVRDFLKVPDAKLREVKTGDTLNLGDIELSFYEVPNVHWPETMVTFEAKSGTLFSCDAFGGYGKTGERIFDDEFNTEEHKFFESESLRYYATIVASFSTFVKKAIEKLTAANLQIKTIAPSHGIVWRSHPETVIERYARYAGYNTGGKCEKEICVLISSMYGNTRKGVEAVIKGIHKADSSIAVNVLNVPETDDSKVLAAAYKAAGLVIAAPTYEYKLFPAMAHVMDLFARKHFVGKQVLRIGSWGWVGGAKKEYDALSAPLNWTQVEQYEWQGVPLQKDFEVLEQKGSELASLVNKAL